MGNKIKAFTVCSILFLPAFVAEVESSDFAAELVSSQGLSGSGLYSDPFAVLGKPTRWICGDSGYTYACSLVYPAWNTDPNGNKLVTTITSGCEIIVKFDHKICDDSCNPYGIDFIVFGNCFFNATGYVGPDEDMEQCIISSFAGEEPVRLSVAQAADGPWYTFTDGPYADTAFPTNAFGWDYDANDWGEELDWLRPVDPGLSVSDFEGVSVADAIDIFYDGSAGGTGFDLKDLDVNDYAALAVDPNTGRKWIQYVKVEYLPGSYYAGEIDGFSDVAGAGDYRHPVGDLNVDCRVDYEDLELFCRHWLVGIESPKDAAVVADIDEDGAVTFSDLALLNGNWLESGAQCE